MERILTVAANEPIAPGVFRLLLDGAAVDDVRAPGQFFNLSVDGFYLRRPISVCDAENGRVTLIYKVVGAGTRALSEYRGTVLLVSHEPEFYSSFITRVVNLEEYTLKVI